MSLFGLDLLVSCCLLDLVVVGAAVLVRAVEREIVASGWLCTPGEAADSLYLYPWGRAVLHPVFGGVQGAVFGILADRHLADWAQICHGMALGAWESLRWSSGSHLPL